MRSPDGTGIHGELMAGQTEGTGEILLKRLFRVLVLFKNKCTHVTGNIIPDYVPDSQRFYILHSNVTYSTDSSGCCFVMSESNKSPLFRLVLFMICLSIAGCFVAGVHYVVVDLPAQNELLQAPTNEDDCSCYSVYMSDLMSNCGGSKNFPYCGKIYRDIYQSCVYECDSGMR